MLEWDGFEVLTFDCYGTLIDWESGIWSALQPILERHGVAPTQEDALERFGALEAEAERAPYREYRSILRTVLEGLGRQFGFEPSEAERAAFASSVGDWPPFPDSTPALQALRLRYKLALISNVDDDLIARSVEQLAVTFDWIITAQQVRSYKPSRNNFQRTIEQVSVPPSRILHVAQSLYHDIAPANALGLATVWVNRRHGRQGFGATPPAQANPDVEVPDLRGLVRAMGLPMGIQ